MIWSVELIKQILDLYKDYRFLWDTKHSEYTNKKAREKALNEIKDKLNIDTSPDKIHRKFKTMKAAYQVEMRNINAAKVRGFFYKPLLHWFDAFHQFMMEIEEKKIKEEQRSYEESVFLDDEENNDSMAFVFSLNQDNTESVANPVSQIENVDIVLNENKKSTLRTDIPDQESSSSDYDYSSDESGDEFQTFADHIAEQLRNMPDYRAVMIQNQINRIFAQARDNGPQYSST